ncbi:MAG: hypothetical protein ACFFBD_25710 [Candidatus Hodarchaeota archaeon]
MNRKKVLNLSLAVLCLLLVCLMMINHFYPASIGILSRQYSSWMMPGDHLFSYGDKKLIFSNSGPTSFPENETIIDYSPVPILVNVSNHNASLVEMRVNQNEWVPMTLNKDFFLLLDGNSTFWYDWLPLDKTDRDYIIEFRENSTTTWENRLQITSALASFSNLSLETIHLKYEFKAIGLMEIWPNNTYLFDGSSRSFQVGKSNRSVPTNAIIRYTGQRILSSNEIDILLAKINDIARFIPNLMDTGLSEACCDEYYPTWTVTITSEEFKRTLIYNERFQPPGFNDFIQIIEDLADNTQLRSSDAPVSWDMILGIVAIVTVIIFNKRRRKKKD